MTRQRQPKVPSAAGAESQRRRERAREPVDAASLAKTALAYLNRRDASRQKLAQHLQRWAARNASPDEMVAVRGFIAELIERYQSSGLIDDSRLAENAVRSLRARGKSARAIEHKLSAQGVEQGSIASALGADRRANADAELEAAKALVQKRRLGMFRPEAERAEKRRKDLAVLARAGFDFDICRRALGSGNVADDEF